MKQLYTLLVLFFISFHAWAMQIFVTTPNHGVITIDVEANEIIEDVKNKIEAKTGVSPENQILEFNATILENSRTLADYNIQKENILQLTEATLSFSEVELNKQKIKLYYNPVNNYLNVSGITGKESYEIYTFLGKKINSGIVYNNKNINIQNLIKGVYLIRFNKGNTVKFIKQ